VHKRLVKHKRQLRVTALSVGHQFLLFIEAITEGFTYQGGKGDAIEKELDA
jgi:hypothetical protein